MTGPIEQVIADAAAKGAARSVIETAIPAILEVLDRHPVPLARDVPTTAHMIGVSERTVDELIRTGELPRLDGVGRRRLVPTAAIEAWVERNTPAPVVSIRREDVA